MDLQKEIWRDVDGYEGKYQVSNFGRVKSLARQASHGSRLIQAIIAIYTWMSLRGRLNEH